jgi:hypothetical protein
VVSGILAMGDSTGWLTREAPRTLLAETAANFLFGKPYDPGAGRRALPRTVVIRQRKERAGASNWMQFPNSVTSKNQGGAR